MARQILLLRGINLAGRNRVSMPQLRDLLVNDGLDNVQTYLQSGNVVLSSAQRVDDVAHRLEQLIAGELGLEISVVGRTRAQLTNVVAANPLGKVAKSPKLYQVSFLAEKPSKDLLRRAEEAATPAERVVAVGREIYAWHPDGAARSKLWALLAGKQLGVTATSRNWTTVTKLLELADEVPPRTQVG